MTSTNAATVKLSVSTETMDRTVLNAAKSVADLDKKLGDATWNLISALAISACQEVNPGRSWQDRNEILLTHDKPKGAGLSPDYAQRVVRMAKHVMLRVAGLIQPEGSLTDNVKAATAALKADFGSIAALREQMAGGRGKGTKKPKDAGKSVAVEEVQKENETLKAQIAEMKAAPPAATSPKAPGKKTTPATAAAALKAWVEGNNIADILAALDEGAVLALSKAINARMFQAEQPEQAAA